MRKRHELAGETVAIKSGEFAGQQYRIEDWWENVSGQSWMICEGNPACLKYAMRTVRDRVPFNNDVVYGKIGSFGHLIHDSELGAVVKEYAAMEASK